MKRVLSIAAMTGVVAACFFLSSCGGGADRHPAIPPASAKAQGFYRGTVGTNGALFAALVTPDDRVFGVYSISVANAVTDVITGSIAESGSNYSGSVLDTYQSGTTSPGTLTGTFTQGSNFSGTLVEQSVSRNFSAPIPDPASYQYDAAATLANIADTWTGFVMLEGGIATTVVDSTGSMTGTMSFGCTYTGNLKPDASGKNFFDATLSLGPTCNQAGDTFKGVAIVAGTGQSKALTAVLNNSSNTQNALLIGSNAPPAATM